MESGREETTFELLVEKLPNADFSALSEDTKRELCDLLACLETEKVNALTECSKTSVELGLINDIINFLSKSN